MEHNFPDWASNFYPSKFIFNGWTAQTVEHAYQAYKTTDKQLREQILLQPTPRHAKSMGRQVELRPDWEQVKFDLMVTLLRLKFNGDSGLAQKLIEYQGRLVEWNTWHDNIWGICTCSQCPGKGENLLGKALEIVKRELPLD